MIENGGEYVMKWAWKICCVAFESGTLTEDRKDAVIVFPICQEQQQQHRYHSFTNMGLVCTKATEKNEIIWKWNRIHIFFTK